MIEIRIPTIVNDELIYDEIFRLVPKLEALKAVNATKLGKLSRQSVALWITFHPKRTSLENVVGDLSDELMSKTQIRLGSRTPNILVGASPIYKSATNHQILNNTDIAIKVAQSMRKGLHLSLIHI